GSLIQGRIDANGQVVLINPNGLIFTEGASVNVGGLVASALQMSDQDYLNGQFTLNALEGSEGRVINSGLLNAATGGTISLLGQSVENKGLISAQLGRVNVAAGKEAIVTFEPNGLVGVRVTEAILQKDLGVDAAIVNAGEVKAAGGKVLMTASTSKDIFSQAVNVGELSAAKSVVVNADGSFTLGAGADIKNTGAINVGAQAQAGEAVLLGANITNQGSINADSQTSHAGRIEIIAQDINETKNQGTVTAIAHGAGKGGDIKLLGEKVGLLDSARVDASGANGGGQILLGGDKTGANNLIKNAQFLYVNDDSSVSVNALQTGDGGKLIAFADDTARIYGGLFARGGINAGYGGFIETSGLKGFEIFDSPDVSSLSGLSGTWLIDPSNIEIDAGTELSAARVQRINTTQDNIVVKSTYASRNDVAKIGWAVIRDVLNNGTGGTVEIKTNGPCAQGATCTDGTIKISANLNFSDERKIGETVVGFDSKLILNADKNIEFTDAATKLEATNNNRLNLDFIAGGDIDLNKVAIATNGGYFTAAAKGTQKLSSTPEVFAAGDVKAANASISTYGALGGGDISLTAKGKADLGEMNFSYDYLNGNNFNLIQVGSLAVAAGTIVLNKDINFND
ncbi:MAG TPA: filamentous hemagglutinin N-terminal domain-containing protein, partial [Cellvibrionaceae bacterium]|nr:filamentous hemagglutinin N-terminal domain-containing protein [Cellvibrionaceae bacterium]